MWASLLALIALSAINNELPPVKYQGNAAPSIIVTVDDTNTKETCGVAPKGFVTQGCHWKTKNGTSVIMAPNPCTFPEATDVNTYAHLLCHEFGHANGWNTTHDN